MLRSSLIATCLFAVPGLSLALPGDPDTSFGVNGKVLTDFGGHHQISSLALQKDGKILAAGGSREGGPWMLVRYLPGGKLDTSFGKGGVVATDFGDAFTWCSSMAVDAQGRIVLAGKTGESVERCDYAVARYLADGSLDVSFGDAGGVVTHFPKGTGAESVMIQKDGKILVSGSGGTRAQAIAVMRHLPNGKTDRAFGSEGTVSVPLKKYLYDTFGGGTGKAALQPDGKILLAGSTRTKNIVARLNPDGTTDTTFSEDGIARASISSSINGLSVSPDGRIILAGGSAVTVFTPTGDPGSFFYYTPRGSYHSASPNVVATDKFGDILIAASANPGKDQQSFSLARFTHQRQSDPAFGKAGQVVTRFGNSFEVPFAMLVQPDGKILTAGISEIFQGGASFALARHEGGRIRPDLVIGNGKKGDNIYEEYSIGQQAKVLEFKKERTTQSVDILIQNDGTTNDSFRFKATRSSKEYGFRCFAGTEDISGKVMKGKYVTPVIRPGKTFRIRVEITSRELDGLAAERFTFQAISRIRKATKDTVMITAFGGTL